MLVQQLSPAAHHTLGVTQAQAAHLRVQGQGRGQKRAESRGGCAGGGGGDGGE